MICYASRTGTKRNLAALKAAGWRLLLSRTGVWRDEGFAYACDNGAWTDHQEGREFDEARFAIFAERFAPRADWIVAPDIVAGGRASLKLSMKWLPPLRRFKRPVLIAVQDGMTPDDLRDIAGPKVGIFLGGSTEYKLAEMKKWGDFAHEKGAHYHVARVNTAKRFAIAIAAGAASTDGTSATRFADTLPLLDRASRQGDLLTPARLS